MNREDIIRMALEAGASEMLSCFTHPNGPTTAYKFTVADKGLEKFAKLVAAAEREACARIAETAETFLQNSTFDGVAEAIRAKGEE